MHFKHLKHLRGKHNQQSHGNRQTGSGRSTLGRGIALGGAQTGGEGYVLRPYDRAQFALDGPDKPALPWSDVLDPTSATGGGRIISVMEQTPEATQVVRRSVYDHLEQTKRLASSILSTSGSVSDRDFLMAERELGRERTRVADYAAMVRDREAIGGISVADLARGLMVESYAMAEVYRETYNRGIIERRRATPHPTDAIMTINPDGTLTYVPSQRAITVATAMNDANHPFGQKLRSASAAMKRISDNRTRITTEVNALAAELSTQRDDARRRQIIASLQTLRDEQRATSSDERQVWQACLDAVESLGFPVAASPGRIPATFATERIPLGQASDVQRRAEDRLNIVQALLQNIIPHPQLGFTKPLSVVIDGQETRAYANSARAEIVLNPNDTSRIMMHEAFHILESSRPAIGQRMNAFLHTRTRNSPTEPLSRYGNYGAGEETKADNFGNPYIGKVYQGRATTEVLSMFADYLLTPPDARQQAQLHDDQEYMQFIVDVLTDPKHYY